MRRDQSCDGEPIKRVSRLAARRSRWGWVPGRSGSRAGSKVIDQSLGVVSRRELRGKLDKLLSATPGSPSAR